MYLPIPSQPDCATAWLEAVKLVDGQHGHEAINVVIDVSEPTAASTLAHPVVRQVNDFLIERQKNAVTSSPSAANPGLAANNQRFVLQFAIPG